MHNQRHTYIAIDLKSFYASVECVERNLDPLNTNLVVADSSRTNKTICLAVSPALKSFGIPGRPRLFEVEQKIKNLNKSRKSQDKSIFKKDLSKNSNLKIDYIVATPRMGHYIQYSTKIYEIDLKYIAPEDIHVYSIDEVFIDATSYLKTYHKTAHELTTTIIQDILDHTGITATAGIGTNLYLAKIAMDIVAKKMPADKNGVRIAELNEMSYRKLLWNHKPITDFWRIGPGYAKRLSKYNLHTMGDIAKASIHYEDLFYKEFGINAELLIDHAWGYESCRMSDIKSYRSNQSSISNGQVLARAYTTKEAETIIQEMADSLALNLVKHNLVCNHLHLYISYDSKSSLSNYNGEIKINRYHKKVAKPLNKSISLDSFTSSSKIISNRFLQIYRQNINHDLYIKHIAVTAENIKTKADAKTSNTLTQYSLFTDIKEKANEHLAEEKELKMLRAIINIKHRYGENAILKGFNFEKEATGRQRNQQIGGHRG